MIRFSDVSVRRGRHLLFQGVSLDIHDGEKIGLVGDNGSGKTSLFMAMLGEVSIDGGDLVIPRSMRKSHVAQETPSSDQSALDYVLDGDTEFRQLEEKIASALNDNKGEEGELYARMEDIGGYAAPARAAKLLSGLGFRADIQHNATRTFSGGWRVRLNLARALMAPSDLLLLDEPTNHLDLDAIVWLEDWLKKYPGTLMLISHDRDFIDGCCRRILHIENQGIRSYVGDYSQFERQRAERLALEQSMFEKQQRKIAHMENYIRRFRYKADKAKQAQSRIKALEKMQLIVPAHVGSPFSFEFKPCHRLSDPILKLEGCDAGYGESVILSEVELSLAGGDRVGLLGANGAGKSTLIKTMAGELPLLSGTRLETRHLNIGYFAQHQMELLDASATPMQHFNRQFPDMSTQEIRNYLGGFDFRGQRVDDPVGPFSGGEKARLALALIICGEPNLLLLDEPTNHLDMEMRHALSVALQSYEGAIMLVSHDRSLLNTVTDRLVLVRDGRVTEFRDDLAAYLRLLKQDGADATKAESTSKPSKKQLRQLTAQKRQQLKPQRDLIRKLEQTMSRSRERIDALDGILNDPQTYETESTSNLASMMQEKSELESALDETENQWLVAAETLEQLERELAGVGK